METARWDSPDAMIYIQKLLHDDVQSLRGHEKQQESGSEPRDHGWGERLSTGNPGSLFFSKTSCQADVPWAPRSGVYTASLSMTKRRCSPSRATPSPAQ
jgi:hypothetical protein